MSETQSPKAGKVEVAVVARDLEASVKFYAGTLGLAHVGDMELPNGLMKRYLYGDTIIKVIGFDTPPELSGPGGMMAGVTGFRYITFAVDDVAAMQKKFEDAGYTIAVPAFEFMPGLFIAIVEDPDGNWVEFVPANAGA